MTTRSLTSARRSSSHCMLRTCQATWVSSRPTGSSTTSSPRTPEVRGTVHGHGCPRPPGLGPPEPLLSRTPDITTELAYLTRELKADPCVAHALALRAAWALGNYHRFFRLYCHAPCMSGYLVDKFADRERKAALKAMIKTYVKLSFPRLSALPAPPPPSSLSSPPSRSWPSGLRLQSPCVPWSPSLVSWSSLPSRLSTLSPPSDPPASLHTAHPVLGRSLPHCSGGHSSSLCCSLSPAQVTLVSSSFSSCSGLLASCLEVSVRLSFAALLSLSSLLCRDKLERRACSWQLLVWSNGTGPHSHLRSFETADNV